MISVKFLNSPQQWARVCVSTGYVNKLLSCKFLYPLSRITFCAYLVHPLVMISVIMHMDSPVHLGRATMVCISGSDTTVSNNLSYKVQDTHKVCSYCSNLLRLTTSDRTVQTYTNCSLTVTVCVRFFNPFRSYVEPCPTVRFSCSAPMSQDVRHGFCCVCLPAVGGSPTLFLM
jgi:hypothetical protein